MLGSFSCFKFLLRVDLFQEDGLNIKLGSPNTTVLSLFKRDAHHKPSHFCLVVLLLGL